jgi:hypothetical protein
MHLGPARGRPSPTKRIRAATAGRKSRISHTAARARPATLTLTHSPQSSLPPASPCGGRGSLSRGVGDSVLGAALGCSLLPVLPARLLPHPGGPWLAGSLLGCSIHLTLPAPSVPPPGAPWSLGPSAGGGFLAPSVPPPGAPCSLGPSSGGGFPAQPAKVTSPTPW